MDKLDKPTYLRKLQGSIEVAPEDSDSSLVKSSFSLSEENSRLKETLKELIHSANHNQETQDKFYQLELYFLESHSYECLLSRILIELKNKLRLSQVELYLVDPEKEIRQLIEEIYGDLSYPNLHYCDNIAPIKAVYSTAIGITLSQEQALLERLFEGCQLQSHSAALLPLVRGNKIIGSLHLGSRDKERFHAGLATNFLHHLGSIVSVCIENSINQERYKHLSLVDILTRAKNRRHFFQVLAKEIARSTRSFKPLSCLFIDIDHFKQINDVHGHLIGDRALRQVAKSIATLMRQSDVLARFGGEEFTVLLPETDQLQALEIAERIRQQVATLQIDNNDNPPLSLTISIGVSSWQASEEENSSAEAIQSYLINQADKGVYQAKQDGRNCIRALYD